MRCWSLFIGSMESDGGLDRVGNGEKEKREGEGWGAFNIMKARWLRLFDL